jgi:hypothetical protein
VLEDGEGKNKQSFSVNKTLVTRLAMAGLFLSTAAGDAACNAPTNQTPKPEIASGVQVASAPEKPIVAQPTVVPAKVPLNPAESLPKDNFTTTVNKLASGELDFHKVLEKDSQNLVEVDEKFPGGDNPTHGSIDAKFNPEFWRQPGNQGAVTTLEFEFGDGTFEHLTRTFSRLEFRKLPGTSGGLTLYEWMNQYTQDRKQMLNRQPIGHFFTPLAGSQDLTQPHLLHYSWGGLNGYTPSQISFDGKKYTCHNSGCKW